MTGLPEWMDPRLRRAAARTDAREQALIPEGEEMRIARDLEEITPALSGLDVPAPQVIEVLGVIAKGVIDQIMDGSPPSQEVAGVTLSAFMFGYFTREEVEREDPPSWPVALRRRAEGAEYRLSRGEPLTDEDIIVTALANPEKFEVMVRPREEG